MRIIGYVRVSTKAQGDDGYGLAAQRDAMERWCEANGHDLLTVTVDVVSGAKADLMHGRSVAIAALENCVADVLLVRALDRATRDQLDAAELFKRAERYGWRLMDCNGADSGDRASALSQTCAWQWPQRNVARSPNAPAKVWKPNGSKDVDG